VLEFVLPIPIEYDVEKATGAFDCFVYLFSSFLGGLSIVCIDNSSLFLLYLFCKSAYKSLAYSSMFFDWAFVLVDSLRGMFLFVSLISLEPFTLY
jgi:hypothetical protein